MCLDSVSLSVNISMHKYVKANFLFVTNTVLLKKKSLYIFVLCVQEVRKEFRASGGLNNYTIEYQARRRKKP